MPEIGHGSGLERTVVSNNHIVGTRAGHLEWSQYEYSAIILAVAQTVGVNIPAAIPTPIPILAP